MRKYMHFNTILVRILTLGFFTSRYKNKMHLILTKLSATSVIAQAVNRWLPTAAARVQNPGLVMWDLSWTKWRWGRFSPSTSVSPANLHSTNFSTITLTYLPGLVQ
jgi:hypothetical protein